MRPSRLLPLVVLLSSLAGCAFHPPEGKKGDEEIPEATTPAQLMVRFERVYELQSLVKYEPLLTSDFRYTFSSASDPNLVTQYGDNWGKDDEVESTKHLFEGYTNTSGVVVPKASRIEMTLSGVQYQPDYEHSDSAEYYQRVIVSSVDMTIEVPTTPDPTTYAISARHEFYVVRGDAAVLDVGQEARVDRWYIRRWDDLSTALAARKSVVGTASDAPVRAFPSWGSLKVAMVAWPQ